MSQAAGQGTQIPPQLSQMTRGGADFSGSQQIAHQMAGHFQSTAIVVPAKTEGQRSVSFAADSSTNPYDQVAPAGGATDVMSGGSAGAAPPVRTSGTHVQTEADIASNVSFRSLHPPPQPKL